MHGCARTSATGKKHTVECSIVLVGDIVGQFFLSGDYGAIALLLFELTESFSALERDLCSRTSTSIIKALRRSDQIIKEWLLTYFSRVVTPTVAPLAGHLVPAYGLVLNLDFRACDCRQLRPVSRKRLGSRLGKSQVRRTFGAITGLNDVPGTPLACLQRQNARMQWIGCCLCVSIC